jgi:hypothetical protein
LDARHETAFAAAKKALVATVPLSHPLPGAVLSLAADATDTHVGAVPQQQVGQHWQPLGFFSKKLSKSEVNYSTFDRELLAAVSGIKHFCSRLEGCPFQLWTDHKPLIFALHRVSPPTSGRQQRHLAFISAIKFCLSLSAVAFTSYCNKQSHQQKKPHVPAQTFWYGLAEMHPRKVLQGSQRASFQVFLQLQEDY